MARKLVTVRIDEDLHSLAKELGVNLSFLTELAILRVAKLRGYDIEPYLKKLINSGSKRYLKYGDVLTKM